MLNIASADTHELSENDRQTIETLYRAFNSGDPELLNDALADDWHDTPMAPGQQPGLAGMKPMVTAFLAAFADLSITPQEVVGSRGRAAVRLTLSGRHVGDWMGVPATNKRFEIDMHEMHHIEDGRITHTWHLEDWAGWRQQIGAA
ncbi:ester cyclase [uncultured Sphingomonas sp.]|uniref:ester cyclase n=1 Tax=uncultured Sphingomonas sp. TaxID=158754 RepID=UPI0035CB602F